MFTTTAGLIAHLAEDVASLAWAVKITTTGNTVLAMTTAPMDSTLAGVTYLADPSIQVASLVAQIGLVPTKVDISGPLSASGISETAIHAGVYDFADVDIYVFNWSDVTMGSIYQFSGKVSDIQVEGRQWTLEASDLLDQLGQSVVEITSANCRAELGDSRCKVPLLPPLWQASTLYTVCSVSDANSGGLVRPSAFNARYFRCSTNGTSGGTEPAWNTTIGGTTNDGSAVWTTIQAYQRNGTVTAVNTADPKRIFADTSIAEVTDFYTFGKVLWLTGPNAGQSMEVKKQTTTTVDLYMPLLFSISAGDTYTIFAGCNKAKATCKDKFLNIYNMRAEPDKPSVRLLSQFGER